MPSPPPAPFVVDHERIADLAHTTYSTTLPPRGGKPGVKSNGRIEHTVLAAFVLSYPSPIGDAHDEYSLISLGTGLKCMPYTSLSVNGDVLHDQHAEVLARRGARLWLLQRLQHEVQSDEIGLRLLELGGQDEEVRRWKLKQGVRVHLYISTLPCGDASGRLLEYQRAAQDHVAGTANTLTPTQLLQLPTRASSSPHPSSTSILQDGSGVVRRGRASSSNQPSTTTLRTKPGRPDAPASICMSCSDKLALWNHPNIGLQGSLLSSILEPIRIHSVTICDHPTKHIFPSFPTSPSPDSEAHREELKRLLAADCLRTLQRARPHKDPNPIVVGWSTTHFPDSKESKLEHAWSTFLTTHNDSSNISEFKEFEPVSCPNSVLFVRGSALDSMKGTVENLASGTKMGASTKRSGWGEALKPAARSVLCRLNWFRSFVAGFAAVRGGVSVLDGEVLYDDAKEGAFGRGTQVYRKNKAALLGDKEDAEKHVERFLASASEGTAVKTAMVGEQAQERVSTQDTTAVEVAKEDAAKSDFKAWLRTSAAFSQFDLQGRYAGTNRT